MTNIPAKCTCQAGRYPILALQAAQYTIGNTAKAANLQGAEQNTKVHLANHCKLHAGLQDLRLWLL